MVGCNPPIRGPLRVMIVEGEPSCPVKFVGNTGPCVPCVIVDQEPALHGRIVGPTSPGLRLQGTYGYFNKVMGYGPLVYFPQWEGIGLVSQELIHGWDGAYQGITWNPADTGPDGYQVPFYDGVNDFDDIWTAALAAAFNGGEGTAVIWARVNAAAVWGDGVTRAAFQIRANAINRIYLIKLAAANSFNFRYEAGGVVETITVNPYTNVNWFHVALTWSASTPPTGEVRAYLDGVQQGATQVGLGAWAGAPAANVTAIGSLVVAPPTNVWHGWLAHAAIWTRALAPAEINHLYNKAFECQGRS